MKIDRHDQAKILSKDEINRLFSIGLKKTRDRALFGVCLYTGTRIAEACSLHTKDVYSIDGGIRPRVTIRRANTKGKRCTRSIPVGGELRVLLSNYSSQKVYLFPLKVIQKISGHKTLSALQKYLEVLDEDLDEAIATLVF
jgi:integrase/recombinase XerD